MPASPLKDYLKAEAKITAKNLSLLKKSVQEWNDWRKRERGSLPFLFKARGPRFNHCDLRGMNLSGADLTGADLQGCDLRSANLSETRLRLAVLSGADLRGVKATWADLSECDFSSANLAGGNFRGADFRGAQLTNANLVRASLRSANIKGTYFIGADLTRADLTWTSLSATLFADCTVRTVKGLSTCTHEGASFIDYHTLAKSGRLPVDFLRDCGLGNGYIARLPDLLREQAPLRCFISYSVKNERFTEKLDTDLHRRDIRSWYFRKAQWGEHLFDEITSEINRCDKVILICSKAALNSPQVRKEIELTMKREQTTGKNILVPIRVDNYLFSGWTHPQKKLVAERTIGDFTGWNRDGAYKQAFETLFETLHRKANATNQVMVDS